MTQTDTRWLSQEQQVAWRTFIEASQLLFETLERELQSDSGLSMADYEVFVRLSETPDRRMRMSELAGKVLFSRSRLSHAVTRLEKQGWLRRVSCDTDRRGMFAELTDAGYDKLVAAAPGHVESVRRHLIDRLGDEQVEQLRAISAAVREPLSDERRVS